MKIQSPARAQRLLVMVLCAALLFSGCAPQLKSQVRRTMTPRATAQAATPAPSAAPPESTAELAASALYDPSVTLPPSQIFPGADDQEAAFRFLSLVINCGGGELKHMKGHTLWQFVQSVAAEVAIMRRRGAILPEHIAPEPVSQGDMEYQYTRDQLKNIAADLLGATLIDADIGGSADPWRCNIADAVDLWHTSLDREIQNQGDLYLVCVLAYRQGGSVADDQIIEAEIQKTPGSALGFRLLSMYRRPLMRNARASSTLPSTRDANYSLDRAIDTDPSTAWAVRGGARAWIEYTFTDPVNIRQIRIFPGDGSSPANYRRSHRILRARLTLDDGSAYDFDVPDLPGDIDKHEFSNPMRWPLIEIPAAFAEYRSKTARITILAVTHGEPLDRTMISEIDFFAFDRDIAVE